MIGYHGGTHREGAESNESSFKDEPNWMDQSKRAPLQSEDINLG